MSHNDIRQKINQISKNLHNNTLTPDDITTINEIDSYFTKTRLNAEKAVKKQNIPNNADWSVILHQAYFHHQYWTAIYNQQVLGDDYTQRIKKILSIIKIHPIQCNTEQIKEKINSSKSRLDDIRRHSIQHREQFLIDQAIAMELNGNISRSKSLLQLKHI